MRRWCCCLLLLVPACNKSKANGPDMMTAAPPDLATPRGDLATAPPPPSGLTATPQLDAVQLSWTAPSEPVDAYQLEADTGGGNFTVVQQVTATQATIMVPPMNGGLTYVVDVAYRVASVRGGLVGAASNVVSARPCSFLACGLVKTRAPGATGFGLGAIAAAGNGFIAVGSGGVLRSGDLGQTWQSVAVNGVTGAIGGLAVSGSTVVIEDAAGAIFTSTDGGASFAKINGTVAGGAPLWDGTRFIAIASPNVLTSSDGMVWTPHAASGATVPQARQGTCAFGSAQYVCTGSAGHVYQSADGYAWVDYFTQANPDDYVQIAFGGGLYVMASPSELYQFPDNMHLADNVISTSHVRYLDGKFIVRAGNNVLWYGPTWTTAVNQLDTYDIAFNQNVWVYASGAGDFWTGTKR